MAGEIGPPSAARRLASSTRRCRTERDAGARNGVCQRILGPPTDRFRSGGASNITTKTSHFGGDRDAHDRAADGTDGAADTAGEDERACCTPWILLTGLEEDRLLRGVEVVRHALPRRNLCRADGPLDLGRSPGLDVRNLLLGELLRRCLAGFASKRASQGEGGKERGHKESSEGERNRHFGDYS